MHSTGQDNCRLTGQVNCRRTEVTTSLSDSLKTGEEHKAEYRIIRPDGEIRWIACKGAPVLDDDGKVARLLGIFQDITDRKLVEEQAKASLKEKEVLLREIHHRVKNNLQVVSSLLSLQAMQTSNSAASNALTESCRRIQVMADIHNRLYESSDIAQIDFDDFISKLANDIVSANATNATRINLKTDLASVTLDIDTAIPCSLIIGELLSNAIKHAFAGKSDGTIRIVLKQGRENLLIQIEDDGIGMPHSKEWHTHGSLGLKLVNALVEQIDGKIIFSDENGTRVTLSFNPGQ